jgi:hypothetical protein
MNKAIAATAASGARSRCAESILSSFPDFRLDEYEAYTEAICLR